LLTSCGCKKDSAADDFIYPVCPEGFTDVSNIEMIDSNLIHCLGVGKPQKEYVINDDSTYQSLLSLKLSVDFCANYSLPNIDFTQRTVLGKYRDGGGCKIEFIRKVCKNESKKIIKYVTKVKEEGGCDMLGYSMNWIVVPKIPKGYNIVFEDQ